MKTQHTQEKWELVPDDGTGNLFIKTESVYVCKIFSNGFEEPNGLEAKANAKLIASAPELLEALKMWQTFCDVGEMPSPSDIGFMDKAIKKATQ